MQMNQINIKKISKHKEIGTMLRFARGRWNGIRWANRLFIWRCASAVLGAAPGSGWVLLAAVYGVGVGSRAPGNSAF